MTMLTKTSVVLAMAVVLSLGAFAVEPAYQGKYGNDEEPGLRPYKAMWRGVKALKFHTVNSFKEGNDKVKVVGSVEVFRGMRRGLVELGDSTYRGMAGQRMPDRTVTCKINNYIDEDMRVRPWADVAPAAAIMAVSGMPPVGMMFGPAVVMVTQNAVDYSAMDEIDREHVAADVQQKRERNWSPDPVARSAEARKHMEREKAEKQEMEAQAPADPKVETAYSGNILEKVRNGEL
jgi:hypothetical protein